MDQEKDTTEQQAAANTPPPPTDQQIVIDNLTPEILEQFNADLDAIKEKYTGKIPFILACSHIQGRERTPENNADFLNIVYSMHVSCMNSMDMNRFSNKTATKVLMIICGPDTETED